MVSRVDRLLGSILQALGTPPGQPSASGGGRGYRSQANPRSCGKSQAMKLRSSGDSPLHIGVDAAFHVRDDGTPRAGIGIHLVEMGLGIALPIRAAVSSEAEAVGVWVVLHLARRLGVQALVSCDNQSVAESIGQRKLLSGRWRADAPARTPLFASRLIHEARALREQISAQVEWTEREENQIPHLLAALGVRRNAELVFLEGDLGKIQEELGKHIFRGESILRVGSVIPVELSLGGLAWQDWRAQQYLDALASRVREVSSNLRKSA